MRWLLVIAAAVSLGGPAHVALAQMRPSLLETREDAWRRQEAERYLWEQRNPHSLNPYMGGTRLEPQAPPPARFDSYGAPRWDAVPRERGHYSPYQIR